EVAVLLAVLDQTRRHAAGSDEPWVALSLRRRWSLYGLSGEAYESVHELAEFGVIDFYDPMPNRRRGKLRIPAPRDETDESSLEPVPYRFRYRRDSFDRPALDTVSEALQRSPLPPRFDDLASLVTP